MKLKYLFNLPLLISTTLITSYYIYAEFFAQYKEGVGMAFGMFAAPFILPLLIVGVWKVFSPWSARPWLITSIVLLCLYFTSSLL